MKKYIVILLMFVCFVSFSNFSSQEQEVDLLKIVPELNEKQFNELKKASVKDKQGFKFVINELGKKNFTKFITTTSKQKVTKEDENKIRQIIKKYR